MFEAYLLGGHVVDDALYGIREGLLHKLLQRLFVDDRVGHVHAMGNIHIRSHQPNNRTSHVLDLKVPVCSLV